MIMIPEWLIWLLFISGILLTALGVKRYREWRRQSNEEIEVTVILFGNTTEEEKEMIAKCVEEFLKENDGNYNRLMGNHLPGVVKKFNKKSKDTTGGWG